VYAERRYPESSKVPPLELGRLRWVTGFFGGGEYVGFEICCTGCGFV
jgi:hypothetical protein